MRTSKPLWRPNNTSMWGWMSSAGPGELVRASPHMTPKEYVAEPTFTPINRDLDLPSTSGISAESIFASQPGALAISESPTILSRFQKFRLKENENEKSKMLAAKMNKASKPQAPKETRVQNANDNNSSGSDGQFSLHKSSDHMNLLSMEESEVNEANGVDNLAAGDFVLATRV
ncbi:hypothetical protein ILUMI_01810 [Ignelater luminosus]|uniref:Uncharacterized protein n=1 Tax=Ignelater luminosus TaxID=2038154 RepID=A0A8K0DIW2_IGNLU|nr:hypothetical protein ILUMI_01810 [Ignelater luminosus]